MAVLYLRDVPSRAVVALLVQAACTIRIFSFGRTPSGLGRALALIRCIPVPMWIRVGANGPPFC